RTPPQRGEGTVASCSRTSRRSWNGNCSFPGPDGYLRPLPCVRARSAERIPAADADGEIGKLAAAPKYCVILGFAGAAEKPLPHKARDSFPSWTSPVRPRSPALDGSPCAIRGFRWRASTTRIRRERLLRCARKPGGGHVFSENPPRGDV